MIQPLLCIFYYTKTRKKMTILIALTALLYFVQLMLPFFLKEASGERERSTKAFNNLSESVVVFFALATLSIVLGIEENTFLALCWLISRIIFLILYTTGVGRKPAKEGSDYEPQAIRSLVWFVSVILLIWMTVNII
jgi:uncharacterized MAPEG superfamily protein